MIRNFMEKVRSQAPSSQAVSHSPYPRAAQGCLQPGCGWELSAGLCPKQGSLPHLCPRSSLSRPCSASTQPFLSSPSLTQDWEGPEAYEPLIDVYFPILGELLGHLSLFNCGYESTRAPALQALHRLHVFVKRQRSKRRRVGQHLCSYVCSFLLFLCFVKPDRGVRKLSELLYSSEQLHHS